MRGWIFLDYNMPYLRQAIPLAASYGMNHVQLSHDIVMTAEAVLDNEQLAKDISELAGLAHSHGMTLYIWTHELSKVPERFRQDGKVNLDDPGFWKWLVAKYDRLFDVVPGVDGLVLTLSETDVKVFRDNEVLTKMTKGERVTRLSNTIYHVCRAHGKGLIVRDWGNLGTSSWGVLNEIGQGLEASDAGIQVMTKYTAGDWYMNARNPLIGAMKRHQQIEEFDLAGEHHGQSQIPWAIPDLIKEEYCFARKKGIIGACGRVERMQNRVIGTPNEINLYAFSKLTADPGYTVEKIWQEWATKRFGEKAARHVIRAMKHSRPIVDKMLYVKGVYFLQDHTTIPSLDYPENHVKGSSAGFFDVRLGDVEKKLIEPDREFVQEVLAEKDEAIALCEASIEDIERARPLLRDEDYRWLRAFFDKDLIMAKTFRALAGAYFEYKLYRSGDDRRRLDSALEALDDAADRLSSIYGEEYQWGIPGQPRSFAVRRLREFAAAIRERTP